MITILADNAIHKRLGIIITVMQEPAKVMKSIKKATSFCLWILTRKIMRTKRIVWKVMWSSSVNFNFLLTFIYSQISMLLCEIDSRIILYFLRISYSLRTTSLINFWNIIKILHSLLFWNDRITDFKQIYINHNSSIILSVVYIQNKLIIYYMWFILILSKKFNRYVEELSDSYPYLRNFL